MKCKMYLLSGGCNAFDCLWCQIIFTYKADVVWNLTWPIGNLIILNANLRIEVRKSDRSRMSLLRTGCVRNVTVQLVRPAAISGSGNSRWRRVWLGRVGRVSGEKCCSSGQRNRICLHMRSHEYVIINPDLVFTLLCDWLGLREFIWSIDTQIYLWALLLMPVIALWY